MATAKSTIKKPVETVTEEKVEVELPAPKAEPVKKNTKKTFAKDELIPCRSVTPGMLLYNGAKSGIPYSWTSAGDLSYIEYQDLLAAMVSRSDYIYDPLFIIEDEDVINDPKWIEVKRLYESTDEMADVMEIINLPLNRFRKTLNESPRGVRNAVKAKVASLISAGEFDSINKIKIIDEICGTDMKVLIG